MVELEERGVVTILRMKGGRGNALNLDLAAALAETFDALADGPARAVVLTGEGRVFGAGVDLGALTSGGPEYARRFLPLLIKGFEQLVTFPKPIVAAVNGHAIAGGAIMMLACDQRLLVRGPARIGLSEIRVGVEFPAWALEIARHTTPPEHFASLILTGRTWPSDVALARGLVDELVEADQLIERACEVATDLASIPAATFAATKLAVRRPMIEAAQRQGALSDAAIIEQWCNPEVLKQVAHFAAQTIGRRA